MDILESLATDHGHLTTLARRMIDELPRFVRGRPQAVKRLRSLVMAYASYEFGVHQPREKSLRQYLASGREGAQTQAVDAEAPERIGRSWRELCASLTRPLDERTRLDLRHCLVALLRDSKAQMQQEEEQLFVSAGARLSEAERHALAMRTVARVNPDGELA